MRFSTDGLYIELIGALIIEMSEVLSSADQGDSIKKIPSRGFLCEVPIYRLFSMSIL